MGRSHALMGYEKKVVNCLRVLCSTCTRPVCVLLTLKCDIKKKYSKQHQNSTRHFWKHS